MVIMELLLVLIYVSICIAIFKIFGSRLLQAAFKFRLGRLASLVIRKLLKYHGWGEPPFRPVVRSGRTDLLRSA